MRTWLVALAALSWLANAAAADSGPPGLAAPSAAPTAAPTAAPGATLPAPEPPSALDDAAQYPASDRGALFENAITVPQGQAEVDLRATVGVAALDLRFGVTSTTELSVEVGMAASSPSTVPEIAVGIKQVLVRGRRFRLAVDGSLRNVFYNPNVEEPACCGAGIGDDSVQSQSIQIGGIGAVATGCVDSRCFFRVSMGGQVWVAFGDNGGTVELAWFDAELGSSRLRLATEGILGFTGGGDGPGQVVAIGLRGGWRHLSLEGGAAIAGSSDSGGSTTLPYFGITGRL